MGRPPKPRARLAGDAAEQALTGALTHQSPGDDADLLLAKAAETALATDRDLDLEAVPDERLIYHDTAATARMAYVVSLLRLLRFLRRRAADFSQESLQAKIAQAHIRHVESSQLAALQIGRSRADEMLEVAVAEVRSRLNNLASTRAKLVVNSGDSDQS